MKYLKLFASHSDYNTAKSSLDKPNVSHCITENHVHYNPSIWAEKYLTFVAKEDGIFTFFATQSSNVISYSTDEGKTWTEGNNIEVNNGDRVMWKGTMSPSASPSYGIGSFTSTANFDVQGNPMSLLFGDNFKGQTNLTGKDYAFYKLFYENTKVVNAENLSLPATTLANYCYNYMFYGCTNLVNTPELPATTLATYCYEKMFQNCTSLTTAPSVLPAETLASYCYEWMFYGCTNLINAPELPATTLADYCYGAMFEGCVSLTIAPELPATTLTTQCYSYMFQNCTSLTRTPVLPATTLANYCYSYMFSGCTSLTIAPELPATTMIKGCYRYMFQNCTSLTTAPNLPATTLASDCYRYMFYGCTNLNYIKAMFTTIPGSSYTYSWVDGVASTGTFVKNSTAQWNVTGVNGVPSGWTVQTASE